MIDLFFDLSYSGQYTNVKFWVYPPLYPGVNNNLNPSLVTSSMVTLYGSEGGPVYRKNKIYYRSKDKDGLISTYMYAMIELNQP